MGNMLSRSTNMTSRLQLTAAVCAYQVGAIKVEAALTACTWYAQTGKDLSTIKTEHQQAVSALGLFEFYQGEAESENDAVKFEFYKNLVDKENKRIESLRAQIANIQSKSNGMGEEQQKVLEFQTSSDEESQRSSRDSMKVFGGSNDSQDGVAPVQVVAQAPQGGNDMVEEEQKVPESNQSEIAGLGADLPSDDDEDKRSLEEAYAKAFLGQSQENGSVIVAPEQAAPQQAAPEQVASEQVAPGQVAPGQIKLPGQDVNDWLNQEQDLYIKSDDAFLNPLSGLGGDSD